MWSKVKWMGRVPEYPEFEFLKAQWQKFEGINEIEERISKDAFVFS